MFTITLIGNLNNQAVWMFGSNFIPRIGDEFKITHAGKIFQVKVDRVEYVIDFADKMTNDNDIHVYFV